MDPLIKLINFCDPVFSPVVSCNTVCSEGHEVTNLVSSNLNKKLNGFMVDRFIKPPVEVVIKFPYEVNVSHIHIHPQVGQQKSTGLEVMSTFMPYKSSWFCGPAPVSGSPSSSANTLVTERIAFSYLNEDENGVVFYCPQRYGRNPPDPVMRPMYRLAPFTWMRRAAVGNLSSLIIRITKTNNSSVPAIGRVEVWGEPSSCLSRTKVDEITRIWKSSMKRSEPAMLGLEITPDERTEETAAAPDIPEEFLDAITCEIMALPVVLPCGKVVDQSTLDQHGNVEANWGRRPSDPFTGVMFSENCRPVLDSSLKARIDRFLVQNQHRSDLKNVPRTVGRAQPAKKPPENLKASAHKNEMPAAIDISGNKWSKIFKGVKRLPPQAHVSVKSGGLQLARSSMPAAKKLKIESNVAAAVGSRCDSINMDTDDDDDVIFMEVVPCKKNIANKPSTCTSSANPDCTASTSPGKALPLQSKSDANKEECSLPAHEKKLGESLHMGLKAVLSGKKSFTGCHDSVAPQPAEDGCGKCKAVVNLFRLPCQHFLCRTCLLITSKGIDCKCSICNVGYKSSDPVRHHL